MPRTSLSPSLPPLSRTLLPPGMSVHRTGRSWAQVVVEESQPGAWGTQAPSPSLSPAGEGPSHLRGGKQGSGSSCGAADLFPQCCLHNLVTELALGHQLHRGSPGEGRHLHRGNRAMGRDPGLARELAPARDSRRWLQLRGESSKDSMRGH